MLVILHVLIAVSVAFVVPSVFKLRLSYITIAATLISGTYLVVVAPAHMAQACESGLVYTGIVLIGIMAARAKLARLELDRTS